MLINVNQPNVFIVLLKAELTGWVQQEEQNSVDRMEKQQSFSGVVDDDGGASVN